MTELRVTMKDCRASGFCCRGVRRFCAQAGYDFRGFVRDGVPVSEIEHIKDARVQKLIQRAKGNHGR